MTKQAEGFSILGMLFWLAVLTGGVIYAAGAWPVYSTYWKVEDTFEGIAKNLNTLTEQEIRNRLPDLMHTQYLAPKDVPDEFYEHLKIVADGEGYVKISSEYHVTAWFLGEPEKLEGHEEGGTTIQGKWRDFQLKMKQEFDFTPVAESSKQ